MKLPYLTNLDAIRACDALTPPDTNAFRRWFGESEVATKGVPIVVYHGTRSPFIFNRFHQTRPSEKDRSDEFATRSNDPNTFFGPHFTDDFEVAIKFMIGEYSWIPKTRRDKPRVYPVYLSIENPSKYDWESELHYAIARLAFEEGYRLPKDFVNDFLIPEFVSEAGVMTRWCEAVKVRSAADFRRGMRHDDRFRQTVYEFALDTFMEHHIGVHMSKMVAAAKRNLTKKGYDGIWYANEGEGGDGWIPFHPSQIKSAIANTGAFSSKSQDIRRNP